MMPFTVIFILRFLPFSLLLFEIANVRVSSAMSPDELNVPYVPYVVVDKHKDEFDYERLQDTIVRYLENQPQRQSYYHDTSTSLYDYLKTSTSASVVNDYVYPQPQVTGNQIYENVDQRPLHSVQQPLSSNTYNQNSYQKSPQQTADTRSMNVYPFKISDIHPAYYPSVYKPGAKIKDNSEVTASVKVTTFQPHRYLTTPLYSPPYANISSYFRPNNVIKSPPSFLETATPKFVPLRMSYATSALVDSIGSESYRNDYNNNEDLVPSNGFPYNSEKKCSLKSSRYVYDGGCVSKKPVVETVCADRCIKYETFDGTKKPYYSDIPYKMERIPNAAVETPKKAVALTCKDGDVKKQKIKLYCKDGTIINNVIRIVNNCICHEHSEKVHTTKRSHHKHINSRTRMMSRPPIKVRVRI